MIVLMPRLMSRATLLPLWHQIHITVHGNKFQLLSTPFQRWNNFPLHWDSSWICWKYHMYWPINYAGRKTSCVRALLLGLEVQIHRYFSSRFKIDSQVREITKSSSTFPATNISSNMVWLRQLYDTIQMISNYTWINYNHDKITLRSHRIYYCVRSLIFDAKFSSIYLAKGEKCLFFRLSFVNLRRAKDGTHMFHAKYRYMFVV